MIEKIRQVRNPLTIIAIFAGLAELAGTVALATITPELQKAFVWFVMFFPILLVVLFFLTLNFNPRVLYAPSDFQNEENFIQTLVNKHKLSYDLENLVNQLEISKDKIVEEAFRHIRAMGDSERKKLSEAIDHGMFLVQSNLEAARESAKELAFESDSNALTQPETQAQAMIIAYLLSESGYATSNEIHGKVTSLGATGRSVQRALDRLVSRGIIERDEPYFEEQVYRLVDFQQTTPNNPVHQSG